MKITGDEPFMPIETWDEEYGRVSEMKGGLTIRQHFAAMAMQGFCALEDKGTHATHDEGWREIAQVSVKLADALINELNK